MQGLPLATQSYSYAQPSALQNILTGSAGSQDIQSALFGDSGGIGGLLNSLFGNNDSAPANVNVPIPAADVISDIGSYFGDFNV